MVAPSALLFESPETAGATLLTVTGSSPQGGVIPPLNAAIGVAAVDQRVPLPASGFKFVMNLNSTGHSGSNQWATPQASLEFQQLPATFAQMETKVGIALDDVPTLVFNSIGLPSGGLFDVDTTGTGSIDNPWHPPHCGHRDGVEMDLKISNLDDNQKTHLADAVTNTCIGLVALMGGGFRPSHCLFFSNMNESPNAPPGVNPNHWHVKAQ
jgi:hypothetical protein